MNASSSLSDSIPQVKLSWRINDLTGKRFGRLLVLRFVEVRTGCSVFLCRCDCGAEIEAKGKNLNGGIVRSCGCLQRDIARKLSTTHGETKRGQHSSEYRCWHDIKRRCTGQLRPDWKHYGGRGIKVCERWFNSFENFLRDMGRKPSSKHTIERQDNDGDYCPENCTWSTRKVQANNRRANHFVEFMGERMTISQWAIKKGIKKQTLFNRLLTRRWKIDRALTEPVRFKRPKSNG